MTKRQVIRKAVIIGMSFTFPVTIAFMSPAMPILYGFHGIELGATIMFMLLFLTSLVFGRAFCGFMCPGGGLGECLMRINDKGLKNNKLRVIKYFVCLLLVVATIFSFISAGGISVIDFFAGLDDGWIFLLAPYRYVIYFGVLFGILLSQLTLGKRSFCQCFCWIAPFMIIGTKVSDFLKLPRLHLIADSDSCNGCMQCSKKCPMSLDVKEMVETSNMNNSECILCGECVDICSKGSISYAFKSKSS